MSDKSKIEWTDATWNPVTGCTKVSDGCKHCYAERDWTRLAAPRAKPNLYTGRAFTDVRCHPQCLDQPLRWRKPRRIFVNSMSDLFHEDVPNDFILQVFDVMDRSPQHVFQILTKRPQRMIDVLGGTSGAGLNAPPLPNVWLGVSCEDQATADARIPPLLLVPAAVHWVSAEPLLGPIDFTDITVQLPDGVAQWDALRCDTEPADCGPYGDATLDWIVAGGESGPLARTSHPDWFRSLRDQCQAAGVPFFFKQWGEWLPHCQSWDFARNNAELFESPNTPGKINIYYRVGKKIAGRELDDRTWDEYPT